MSRVVMIDDDRIVRQYIRTVLEKSAGEFELVGEVASGAKGLQMIEALRPDMLILDIEMPSMDGIELLRQLEKRRIVVRVLVLSCHDEFEYVRQAMKLGASDYLLKHKIDDETLLNALRALRDRPVNMTVPHLAERVQRRQTQLGALLAGTLPEEKRTLTASRFADSNQAVVVCSAEIDYLQSYIRVHGKEAGAVLERRVWESFQNTAMHGCQVYLNRAESGCYGMLLIFDQLPVSQLDTRRQLYHVITSYIAQVAGSCQSTITVGVSERMQGTAEIHRQWLHARQAMAQKFYLGCARLIFFEQMIDYKADETSQQMLLEGMRKQPMNRQEMMLAVESLFENIKTSPMPLNQFQHLFYTLLNLLMRMISRLNLEIDQVFPNVDFVSEALETLETLEDYRRWFLDAVDGIFHAAQKSSAVSMRQEIVKAIEYISQHYMEEITLEAVSQYVNVSKTYFSSIFRKETGEKFSIYLLNFRLQKACEMLRQGDLKIYNIAYDVGFQSHNYFNNIFKERYGMTPKEYRRQYQWQMQQCNQPDIQGGN